MEEDVKHHLKGRKMGGRRKNDKDVAVSQSQQMKSKVEIKILQFEVEKETSVENTPAKLKESGGKGADVKA